MGIPTNIGFFIRAMSYLAISVAAAVVAGSLGEAIDSTPDDHCPLTLRYSDGFGSDTPCEFVLFVSISTSILGMLMCIITFINLFKSKTDLCNFTPIEGSVVILSFIFNLSAGSVISFNFKKLCDSIPYDCENFLNDKITDLGTRLKTAEGAEWAVVVIHLVTLLFTSVRCYAHMKGAKPQEYKPYEEGADYVPPSAPATKATPGAI
eukprot:m.155095 g.155095  ORF g.155095 m.155095 type:complete len:207 (-) comp20803_c0_seq1:37-657(-)